MSEDECGFDVFGADDKSSQFDYGSFLRSTVGDETEDKPAAPKAEAPKEKTKGEKAWEGIKGVVPGLITTVSEAVKGKDKKPEFKPGEGMFQTQGSGMSTGMIAGIVALLAAVGAGGYFLLRKH